MLENMHLICSHINGELVAAAHQEFIPSTAVAAIHTALAPLDRLIVINFVMRLLYWLLGLNL